MLLPTLTDLAMLNSKKKAQPVNSVMRTVTAKNVIIQSPSLKKRG
jgi:hypothetical protein